MGSGTRRNKTAVEQRRKRAAPELLLSFLIHLDVNVRLG